MHRSLVRRGLPNRERTRKRGPRQREAHQRKPARSKIDRGSQPAKLVCLDDVGCHSHVGVEPSDVRQKLTRTPLHIEDIAWRWQLAHFGGFRPNTQDHQVSDQVLQGGSSEPRAELVEGFEEQCGLWLHAEHPTGSVRRTGVRRLTPCKGRTQHGGGRMDTVIDRYLAHVAADRPRWASMDQERLVNASALIHEVVHPRSLVLISARPDRSWATLHLGIWSAAAIPVSLPRLAAAELAVLIGSLSLVHGFTDTASAAEALLAAGLKRVVMFGPEVPPPGAKSWASFVGLGAARLAHNDKDAEERFRAAAPDGVAVMVPDGETPLRALTHSELLRVSEAPPAPATPPIVAYLHQVIRGVPPDLLAGVPPV